jgi:hypothetical protein
MEKRRLLAAGAATGIAAGIVSSRGYADGGNGDIDRDIVGSWFGTVTATNPPLGSFNDLISFHVGGVVTESRRYLIPGTLFGNLLETTGHGIWKRTGKLGFEAFFQVFWYRIPTPAPPSGPTTSTYHSRWTEKPASSPDLFSRKSRIPATPFC